LTDVAPGRLLSGFGAGDGDIDSDVQSMKTLWYDREGIAVRRETLWLVWQPSHPASMGLASG
jgi:hypothetical protein